MKYKIVVVSLKSWYSNLYIYIFGIFESLSKDFTVYKKNLSFITTYGIMNYYKSLWVDKSFLSFTCFPIFQRMPSVLSFLIIRAPPKSVRRKACFLVMTLRAGIYDISVVRLR